MSETHVRTDPNCSLRWLWTINTRPWYIPAWYERRTRGRACITCLNRQSAMWTFYEGNRR